MKLCSCILWLTILVPHVIRSLINTAQQSGQLVDREDAQVLDRENCIEALDEGGELMLHAIDKEHLCHSLDVFVEVCKSNQLVGSVRLVNISNQSPICTIVSYLQLKFIVPWQDKVEHHVFNRRVLVFYLF